MNKYKTLLAAVHKLDLFNESFGSINSMDCADDDRNYCGNGADLDDDIDHEDDCPVVKLRNVVEAIQLERHADPLILQCD